MAWDFIEILENVLNLINLFPGSSSTDRVNADDKPAEKKKSKYFTEKVSGCFIVGAAILFFFVFKDPLPAEKYTQTLIVTSLIGTAVSGLLFFLLYVLKLYYFKSFFKLLFFSSSVILFFISLVMGVYFRSGVFV